MIFASPRPSLGSIPPIPHLRRVASAPGDGPGLDTEEPARLVRWITADPDVPGRRVMFERLTITRRGWLRHAVELREAGWQVDRPGRRTVVATRFVFDEPVVPLS